MSITTEESESSRSRILKAAAEIAAERGYDGTTISRVCERSGLPVSSVYWFFKDKDELLADVVSRGFDQWLAEQPSWLPLPLGKSRAEGLKDLLLGTLAGLPKNPDFLRIGFMLAMEERQVEPVGRTRFIEVRSRMKAVWTGWMASALDAATLQANPLLPERLAMLVIAFTDGLFIDYQVTASWESEVFVDLVVALIENAVENAQKPQHP